MKQIWWYGQFEQPHEVDCLRLERSEDFDRVRSGDLVLVSENEGLVSIQDLLGELVEDAEVLVVCQTTTNQHVRKWKSIGCRAVPVTALVPYLQEMQTMQTMQTMGSSYSNRVQVDRESDRPVRKQLPSIQNPKPSARPVTKSPTNGGFFSWPSFQKNDRRKQRVHPQLNTYEETWHQPRVPTHGRIVAVVSNRGRVGKTLFTANAAALCAETGLSALVMEAGVEGNLASILACAPQVTQMELLNATHFENIEDFIDTRAGFGFDVLFAGRDGELMDEQTLGWLKEELKRIRQRYSVIFIDLPPDHNDVNVELLSIADEVLFFCQPDIEMLDRIAERYRLLLEPVNDGGYGLHVDAVHPVLTRIKKGIHSREDCEDVSRSLSDPIAILPEVPNMHKFMKMGDLIALSKPHHRYTRSVMEILEHLQLLTPRRKWGKFA